MKIYIGMSKPQSAWALFADLIRAIENRPYDHIYIRLPEPMDQEYMIFQASKEMVNLYNKDIFLSINVPIKEYEIDITDVQYQALWRFVRTNLGIPYSLKEDFGILLMKIFNMGQPFNDGLSAEFCSKLGALVCLLLGIKIPENPGSIDPKALDQILSADGLPCVNNPTF